jgi:RNA polymerase sigma-70 factor (ECF subfamily)
VTDAQLVEAIQAGSSESASVLAARYLRACRAVALAIVGETSAADDVCQDSFIYAIEHIDDLQRADRVRPWLFQIVRNRARNHLRDRKAERTISIDLTIIPSNTPSPSVDAERSEMRTRLLAALLQLPEDRREVVVLHDLEGWTHQEIAEHTGLPAGTVRSHLHYARRELRELLADLQGVERNE